MITTTVPKPKPSSILMPPLLEPQEPLRRIVTQWQDEGAEFGCEPLLALVREPITEQPALE
jgi:hypothetical protein